MEPTDCPICGNNQGRTVLSARDNLLGHPGTFREVCCPGCGLLYLNPRPTPAEMPRYYTGEYAPHLKKPKPLRHRSGFARRLRRVFYRNSDLRTRIKKDALSVPQGKVLDVGCGTGALVYRLQELGWEASGVEIDPGAVEAARGLGLDVRLGTLEQAGYPDDYFDMATVVHVLEHIHYPVEFLSEVWRVLKAGGLLYIEVPSTRSFNFQTFRAQWFHLDAPRHLCSYSPKPLRILLEKTGFRIQKLCFVSGTTGLRGSIQYRRRAKGLRDYDWIHKKTAKKLLGLFTFALDIARLGDVIRIDAVKR
jgi:SAM-dependent methyltransferase